MQILEQSIHSGHGLGAGCRARSGKRGASSRQLFPTGDDELLSQSATDISRLLGYAHRVDGAVLLPDRISQLVIGGLLLGKIGASLV
ncbi:MAG: hypothetical protein V4754_21420 [Pseudomonadota bacterium]